MWLLMADAPADVPAITAPCLEALQDLVGQAVPPSVELRRSWLPPVRKIPVASRRARTAASSFACWRVTAWIGRTVVTPSSPKTAR